MKKKLVCMVLVLCLMVTMFPLPAAAQEELVEVTVVGNGVGSSGYYAVRDFNKQRTEAGLQELNQNAGSLRELANQRAAEISVYYSENRPDGSDYTTIFTGDYTGENVQTYENYTATAQCIAVGCTIEEALEGWLADKTTRGYLFSEIFTEVGVGGFMTNGVLAWVLLFGNSTDDPKGSSSSSAFTTYRTVSVRLSDVKLNLPDQQLDLSGVRTLDMTDEERFDLTFTVDNPGTDAVDPILYPSLKAYHVADEYGNVLVNLDLDKDGTLTIKGARPGSGVLEYTIYEGQIEPFRLEFNLTDVGEHDHTYTAHWVMTQDPSKTGTGMKQRPCAVCGEYTWSDLCAPETPHPNGYPVEVVGSELYTFSMNINKADPGHFIAVSVDTRYGGQLIGAICTSADGVVVEEAKVYNVNQYHVIVVTMPEGPLTIEPILDQDQKYDITVNIHGEGSGGVTLSPEQAYYHQEVDLDIHLQRGYVIQDAIFTCDAGQPMDMSCYNDGTWHFRMPDGDLQIDIYLRKRGTHHIYVYQTLGGTVTLDSDTAMELDGVTLTAIPNEGYVLDQVIVYTNGTYAPEILPTDRYEFLITVPDGDVYIEVHFLNTNNPFVDVKQDAYYYIPVLWAASNGITAGLDATHFGPNNACTRAQVVTFLWRAAGCPEPTTTEHPFVDIQEGSYYYKAVLWAVENGITAGVDATHFGPNQGCTRAQVATFLWRACGQPEPLTQENPFRDTNPNSYYYKAVLWAVENGITAGTGNNRFSPDNICTRGQIVSFLYRTFYG